MSKEKKPYVPPAYKVYSSADQVPEHLRRPLADLLSSIRKVSVICDRERRYRSVSPSFAELLGYEAHELEGKRVDDITARDSIDIDRVFDEFFRLGEMDGLWLFQHRQGRKMLFRYRAVHERELVYTDLEPLPLAG